MQVQELPTELHCQRLAVKRSPRAGEWSGKDTYIINKEKNNKREERKKKKGAPDSNTCQEEAADTVSGGMRHNLKSRDKNTRDQGLTDDSSVRRLGSQKRLEEKML